MSTKNIMETLEATEQYNAEIRIYRFPDNGKWCVGVSLSYYKMGIMSNHYDTKSEAIEHAMLMLKDSLIQHTPKN